MPDSTADLDPYNPDAVRTVAYGFDDYADLLADLDYDEHIADLARDYMTRADNDAWDSRRLNYAIAHWANLMLDEMFEFNGRVTTTRYDERVILEWESRRNPDTLGSFVVRFSERFDASYLTLPDEEDEYIEEFRTTLRGLILVVVQDVEDSLDRVEQDRLEREQDEHPTV